MILTLRRSLLVLLALLQLVAPLVHAHSGNNFSQFGLHLPNLEIYSAATQQSSPTFQSDDYLSNFDAAIVSISTGIKNQHNNDNLLPPLYFPPPTFIFSPAINSCEINFSPQSPLCTKIFSYSPQSPRAPPYPF